MGMKSFEFPEVSEAAAAPGVRAIFGEIKQLSGVPMVVLIYRHLATWPGVLEEVWDALRPVFLAGVLQEAAWAAVERSTPGTLIPPIGADLRPLLGLDAARFPAVCDVLDAYNRANPVNLAACACVLARLRDASASRQPLAARAWSPPPALTRPLSPMIAPADIAPDLRRLIGAFGFGDPGHADSVVPSVFRHFADLPAFLVVLHDALKPRMADGSYAAAVEAVRAAVTASGEQLAPHLPPLPALAASPAACAALERFVAGVIPQMVAIGYGLRRALAASASAGKAAS